MKLWIRCQNKVNLLEVNHISYDERLANPLKNDYTPLHKIYGNGVLLGIYATEERCLKIIDEIQKLIEVADPTKAFLNIQCDGILDYKDVQVIIDFSRKHNASYIPNGKVELIMPNVITYQMPEK